MFDGKGKNQNCFVSIMRQTFSLVFEFFLLENWLVVF